MSDFEGFGDVIGRASDLAPDLPPAPKPRKETIHPLVAVEQLERPSPRPFQGRPDMDHPELDFGEPLYIPRFLVKQWGAERFLRSPYYELWKSEAGRAARLSEDKKPSEQKKR